MFAYPHLAHHAHFVGYTASGQQVFSEYVPAKFPSVDNEEQTAYDAEIVRELGLVRLFVVVYDEQQAVKGFVNCYDANGRLQSHTRFGKAEQDASALPDASVMPLPILPGISDTDFLLATAPAFRFYLEQKIQLSTNNYTHLGLWCGDVGWVRDIVQTHPTLYAIEFEQFSEEQDLTVVTEDEITAYSKSKPTKKPKV